MTAYILRRDEPGISIPGADLPAVLERLYVARGVRSAEDLNVSLAGLLPFRELKGIAGAVDLLLAALDHQHRVLVVGDFDADGATASTVAVLGLRAFGLQHIDYLVPNRFEYGYGLTPEIVAVAQQRDPQLLITVDNGISSIEGVRAARELGIEVLVTDHHLPGAELPAASAIVNPNQPGCEFSSKYLAGVGVMFYLLAALRARLREQHYFAHQQQSEPDLAALLDLVALGTVADVVPLDRNNRILVEQGLRRIRAGHCRPGITALLRAGGRDPDRAVATDLGFAVGPRLNAAGRLADMAAGIECLLENDPDQCRQMAWELDALNRERREIEAQMQDDALATLETLTFTDTELPFGLCLYESHWHPGVVGILAARIRERVHRPVIAFAPDGETLLKGSGRSIPGLHLRDALDAIAARNPDLLSKFGGHAMAAGLSLRKRDLEAFGQAFDAQLREMLNGRELDGTILSDGELSESDLSLELARVLRRAGPWGQGFPEPVFDGEFELLERRILKDRHLKLRLRAGTVVLDAIAFNTLDEDWPAKVERIHVAYRLDVNDYRDRETLQLIVQHLEPL